MGRGPCQAHPVVGEPLAPHGNAARAPTHTARWDWADLLQEGGGRWLGGRDSNPDSMVQSHVSCRWTTSQSHEASMLADRLHEFKPAVPAAL